jgi:ABC-2 type transport system ATP-binding protein
VSPGAGPNCGDELAGTSDNLSIDLHHVAKIYRRNVHALRGIEMQVGRGEIFGLLGPNGAGKTTLVKIMMTVIRPTRADGTVLGRPVGHRPTLRRVGYLPEYFRCPAYLTGRQALEYYAALSKVGRRARKRRAAEMLATVGMTDRADAKIGTYSRGMVQRIGVAQALMHDPELVLLDEPTAGLDPVGRRDVREVLTQLRSQGRTVFLNSHLLSEVEMVCDRVAILKAGEVVRQGRLDELTRPRRMFEIELAGGDLSGARDVVAAALTTATPPTGGAAPAGGETVLDGECIRVEGFDAAGIQPAIDALRARGMVIRSIRQMRQTLEDLFIETVTGTVPPPLPPLSPAAGKEGGP